MTAALAAAGGLLLPRPAQRAVGMLVAIGFVEYATRHLLWNPKVIASNQFESYFRVNSLFFDPNIYGRSSPLSCRCSPPCSCGRGSGERSSASH